MTNSRRRSVDDEKIGEARVDVDLKLRDTCRKGSSSCGMELLVVVPMLYRRSAGHVDGAEARSSARFGDKGEGASPMVVKLWSWRGSGREVGARRWGGQDTDIQVSSRGGSTVLKSCLQLSHGGGGVNDLAGMATGVARRRRGRGTHIMHGRSRMTTDPTLASL